MSDQEYMQTEAEARASAMSDYSFFMHKGYAFACNKYHTIRRYYRPSPQLQARVERLRNGSASDLEYENANVYLDNELEQLANVIVYNTDNRFCADCPARHTCMTRLEFGHEDRNYIPYDLDFSFTSFLPSS